jgi:plasmid stabilization system protein ParE
MRACTTWQSAWLSENGPEERAANLLVAIEEVAERLAQLPDVGALLRQGRRLVLRKLISRRLPYVAWYAHRRPSSGSSASSVRTRTGPTRIRRAGISEWTADLGGDVRER